MKRMVSILLLLSIALPAGAADAADRVQQEVKAMGLLNGQALACSHPEIVANIKALIIKLVPKSRSYGAAFQTATNEGYLAQNKNEQATCQDGSVLAAQVDEAAKRLQTAVADMAAQ